MKKTMKLILALVLALGTVVATGFTLRCTQEAPAFASRRGV
jgi:hypothetical protein